MLDAVPQRPIGVVPADLLELYFEIKPSGTDSSAWLLIREELVKRGHPPRTWTAIKEKRGSWKAVAVGNSVRALTLSNLLCRGALL